MLFNWLTYIYCKNFDKQHIRSITLEVTTKCNNRCVMCNIWKLKDKSNDMKLEDIEKIFKNSKLKNVRNFALMGGETYLYDHLVEATRMVKEYLPTANLFTSSNCYAVDLVTKKAIEMNKIMPLNFCASLDGIGETHNRIRGAKDSYEHVMKTIKILKQNGIEPFISFTIIPENYRQLAEVYKKARELNINMSSRPASSGIYFDNPEKKFLFDEEQKAEIIKQMKQIDYAGNFLLYGSTEFLKGNRILPCGAGYFSCFITKDFSVYPCTHCPKEWIMGNLKDTNFNLEKVLDSEQAKKVRRKVDKCEHCINDMEFCPTYSMQQFKVAFWLLKRKPPSWFLKQLFKK